MQNLSDEIRLPCGVAIKNRIAKSAMSETLGSRTFGPTAVLIRAYERWAEGGCGLVITGNVMIDSSALGEPKNVVIENQDHLKDLKEWAKVGTKNNTQLWVQLNHPGKQSPAFLSKQPVAPSAIAYGNALRRTFNMPRELKESEIEQIIERFAVAAQVSKEAGFTGVQIHGAHGYLVSQFLSPLHNQRKDKWGGSLENRARFVSQVLASIRQKVGPGFPIGIKINSSDFLKGGFTTEESIDVILSLAENSLDLVEVSGGSYERPAMIGLSARDGEKQAYFADFCKSLHQQCKIPIMLTGGFRSAKGMREALTNGVCDIVGLARPLAVEPDLPNRIMHAPEEDYRFPLKPISTGIGAIDKMGLTEIVWYEHQIKRIGMGLRPKHDLSPYRALLSTSLSTGLHALKRRRS